MKSNFFFFDEVKFISLLLLIFVYNVNVPIFLHCSHTCYFLLFCNSHLNKREVVSHYLMCTSLKAVSRSVVSVSCLRKGQED